MHTRPLVLTGLAVLAGTWLIAEQTVWRAEVIRGEIEWRKAVAADSVPVSIADAETQGARYPRSTARPVFPPSFEGSPFVGTPERRCVDVDTASWVRAGEFFAGSFTIYAEFWEHPYGKLGWVAGHDYPLKVPVQFTLRASRLDTTGYAFVYKSPVKTVRRFEPHRTRSMGMGTWIVLPTRGKWVLVSTMHEDWGCFVFTL